ncbi:MAG: BLUF domain-containing protein [Bacteroidota bacterium]
MPQPLIQLIYTSKATRLVGLPTLTDILRVSRRNNARDQVTGLLLYHEGSFIQVFEGLSGDVNAVYRRVLADPRHRDVSLLVRRQVAYRSFPNWAMGFRNIAELTEEQQRYVSTFLQDGTLRGVARPGLAHRFLDAFRERAEQSADG